MTLPSGLPRTWSTAEVIEAFGISEAHLNKLIRDGKVGFLRAKRGRRFDAHHVEEIRGAIEVKAAPAGESLTGDPVADQLMLIGVTRRSALYHARHPQRRGKGEIG